MRRVAAPIAWPSGKVYLFERDSATAANQGTKYFRHDFLSGVRDGEHPIAPNWTGLRATRPDAAVYWGFGKAYLFYGGEYVRYDVAKDAVDPEYLPPNPPFTIAGNWNIPWTNGLDAAMNWGNGKVYFFRGSQYLRYDITFDRMDDGYPRPIAGNWNGIWTDGVDGALYQGGNKAYFFKGSEYRRYDIALDTVDDNGAIDTMVLEPAPSGMVTAARDLSLPQANTILGYLIQSGKLQLNAAQTPYVGDWLTGITSPKPSTRVVIKPAEINGVRFVNDVAPGATVIDNVDQRMVVALYRFARWINSSSPDVSAVRHLGIGHGGGAANDCHNQGRALDFSGVHGASDGVAFTRNIQLHWGNLPVVAGQPLRLDPAVDPIAHLLFLLAWRFGTFECENNGIADGNKWPGKDIGDVGGFVIYPDYIDAPPPAQQLRARHQNHIHMQVGKTLV
jgi:hypothetical protein